MGRNNDQDDYGFANDFLSQIRNKKRIGASQNNLSKEAADEENDVYSWTGGGNNMTLHSRFSNRSTGSSQSSDADDEDFFGEKSSDGINSGWDGNLDYTQATASDEYGTNYGDSQVGLDEDFDDKDSWQNQSDDDGAASEDGNNYDLDDGDLDWDSNESSPNEFSSSENSTDNAEFKFDLDVDSGKSDDEPANSGKSSLYQRAATFIIVCGLSCAVLGLCIFISSNKDNTSEVVDTQTETSVTSEASVTETTTVAESEESTAANNEEASTTAVEITTTAEATTTTVADGTYATLQLGDKNDDVLKLQQRLYDLKYVTKDCVTGYYGEFTAKMVKRFQYNAGLEATGIADSATQAALYADDAPAAA